jgi:DNA-binding response OmpR family regulator
MRPGAVLLDYMLGDDDGLKLGLELKAHAPGTQIVIMTGGGLSDEELTICAERGFPILFKPFLAHDVLNLISGPYRRTLAAGVGSINTAGSRIRADPA